MISKFNICKEKNCSIVIQDTSSFYSDFEENPVEYTYNTFKYQDTITLNIIKQHTIDKPESTLTVEVVPHACDIYTEAESIDGVIVTPFTAYLDETHYTFFNDGYYTIYHIILPTKKWYDEAVQKAPDFLKGFSYLYIFDTSKQCVCNVSKDGTITDLSEEDLDILIKEEFNPNLESTIAISYQEIFIKCFLENCYLNYSQKILESQLNPCSFKYGSYFERDFIWMTLNVISYYIEREQFWEAQRILEQATKCNGICPKNNCNRKTELFDDCGCNK